MGGMIFLLHREAQTNFDILFVMPSSIYINHNYETSLELKEKPKQNKIVTNVKLLFCLFVVFIVFVLRNLEPLTRSLAITEEIRQRDFIRQGDVYNL